MPAPSQPHNELVITNSSPATTARNEIWRADALAGPYVRINSNVAVNGTYRDYQIAWNKPYWYIVRVIATNGTFADSAAQTTFNAWTPSWSWLSEPDGANAVWLRWNPTIDQRIKVRGEDIEFDGRELPLSYAGDQVNEQWDLGYRLIATLDTVDQWAALETLVIKRRGKTLMFRDPLGNLRYGTIRDLSRHIMTHGIRSEITATFRRTDYSVAV